MSNKEVKVTITAVDDFSKTFDKFDEHILDFSEMTEKANKAFNDFTDGLNSNKFNEVVSEITRIGAAMQTLPGKAGLALSAIKSLVENFNKLYEASKQDFASRLQMLGEVASTIAGVLGGVASGFIGLVEGVTGADLSFTGLVSTAADFEQNMARVGVLTNAQTDGMEKMTEAAQRLATEYGYGVDEISSGMIDMASAGMNVTEILGGIETVTKLATSGNMDLARSAEIVTNGLNAFNMEMTKGNVLDFANTLAVVADKSATDVNQLGEALTNCGAQAGNMRYSIQDVGAVLGIMADSGIKAGRAGTSLKNVIDRLASGNSTAKKAIEEYNLHGFEQEMLNKNLAGAMMKLCEETERYSPAQKQAIATALAGAYGMNGLIAVMNEGEEGIKAYCEELEKQNQLQEEQRRLSVITAEVMDTTKGKMEQLASSTGVVASELREKFEPGINKALDGALAFVRGLVEVDEQGNVTLKTLNQLAQDSVQWGKNLEQGIQDAINGIKEFVTGGALDNILTIGTNIIQGICKGISNNKEGLQETFSTLIQKACEFIKTNSPAIAQAGKDILEALAGAIRENEAVITEALESLCGVFSSWAEGSSALKAAGGKFADSLIKGMAESFIPEKAGAFKEKWNAFWDFFTVGNGQGDIKNGEASAEGGLGQWFSKIPGKVKEWMFGKTWAAEVDPAAQEAGLQTGTKAAEGMKTGMDDNGQPIVDSAVKTGTDSAAGIQTALESMDPTYLQALKTEMDNVGATTTQLAQTMSTDFATISSTAATEFANLATTARQEMANVSTAVRDEMLNCSKIVDNQSFNMAEAMREDFVNMGNIAKNQFSNIASSVRDEMINCTNIMKSQAANMVDALDEGLDGMAKAAETQFTEIAGTVRDEMLNCSKIVDNQAANMVEALEEGLDGMATAAETQMDKVVAAVRNGMTEAKNIASETISIKITSSISKNVHTTYTSSSQTMSSIARNSLMVPRPDVMATGGGGAAINKIPSREGMYTFTIPVVVDGREVARATAKYSQSELDRLSRRNSRKRGE